MPVRAGGNHFVGFGTLGAIGALLAAAATDVAAQDQANNVVQTCIYQPNIDHTKILDDRTILFFMRTHVTYQNILPEQCYSLYQEKRFTYGSASMHRLCAGNLIMVLTDLTPGSMSRGSSCKLGLFVQVDTDEVDELIAASESRSKKNRGAAPKTITSVPVQLPPATEPLPAPVESQAPQRAPAQPAPPAPDRPPPAEPDH
jgi:hypothetical protein